MSRSFFPMARRERNALAALTAFSGLAFLPVFGQTSVFGVAVFGWLMAALLLGSPAALLVLLLLEPAADREKTGGGSDGEVGAGGAGTGQVRGAGESR